MKIQLTKSIAPWASPAAQQRLEELRAAHCEDSAAAVTKAVTTALDEQEALFSGVLNLYAGSNVLSPAVASAHRGSLATRPALGWPGEKVQPGLDGIEAIEVIATQQLRSAFNAEFAEPRFMSATMANLAAYQAFTEPGDTIGILSPAAGSHMSHQSVGTAGVRGLRTEYVPFDVDAIDVDAAKLERFLTVHRPRMLLIGGSVIQFATDLAPIRELTERHGAKLVFDASHVAGLIAAGEFANPLDHGVDLVTFSTYKTLAGPAGGATVTNCAEAAARVSHALYPMMSSNYDPARLGPLAIATAEAVDQSPAWAKRTVEIARAIAQGLARRGFPVLGASRGFTDSHQVVVDVSQHGGGEFAMRELERRGVLAGACRVPSQNSAAAPQGVRLGTQEIVRLGAGFEHVPPIVELVATTLAGAAAEGPGAAAEIRRSFGADIWGRTPR